MRKTRREIISILLASAIVLTGCSGGKQDGTGQVLENGDGQQTGAPEDAAGEDERDESGDRKSTRLNSSH